MTRDFEDTIPDLCNVGTEGGGMRRRLAGLDQQGRYPTAAHAANEYDTEDEQSGPDLSGPLLRASLALAVVLATMLTVYFAELVVVLQELF